MSTFTYQIAELDYPTKKWSITKTGTATAADIEDVLDQFDFGGIVEQQLMKYSDGTIERVWNRSGDIYNVDRVGLIVFSPGVTA